MKVISKNDIPESGRMILLYGETGKGKTVTAIQTSPDPILYIQTEPRSLKPSLDAVNRPDLDMDITEYKLFPDLIEFLSKEKNTERYQTVILDSLTHLSNVELSSEIEDEAFEAKTKEEQSKKPLVNKTKLSLEGYGGLSSNLFRLTSLLGKISRRGKIVIMICLQADNPKYDRELAGAPALKGREYPNSMPGFFDLIGKVEDRIGEDRNIIYPPLVRFSAPDGSFMAKFTGSSKTTSGPLHIGKILGSTTNYSKELKNRSLTPRLS